MMGMWWGRFSLEVELVDGEVFEEKYASAHDLRLLVWHSLGIACETGSFTTADASQIH